MECISDIGISTGAYQHLSLGAALLRIAELSSWAEILSYGPHSLTDPVNARVVELAGLPFSVHGPFAHFEFGSRSSSKHRAAMELHRRHIWTAAELGAGLYVVHPDLHRRPRAYNKRIVATLEHAFEEFAELEAEVGLPLAIENLPFFGHTHFVAPGDLDLKGLGVALDVGHAAVTGTLADWLAQTNFELRHVHLHDNLGESGSDTHHPLGTGVVDAAEVLAVARAAGATVVLEHTSEDEVLKSLAHLEALGLLRQDRR